MQRKNYALLPQTNRAALVACLTFTSIAWGPTAKSSTNLHSMALQQATRKTIIGTVTDAHGDPLIGVSIRIKNAQGGTITDIDGKFTIQAPELQCLLFQLG